MVVKLSNVQQELLLKVRLMSYWHVEYTPNAYTLAEATTALVTANSEFLMNMSNCVEKHLNQCGRRWVDLSSVFSFMKV